MRIRLGVLVLIDQYVDVRLAEAVQRRKFLGHAGAAVAVVESAEVPCVAIALLAHLDMIKHHVGSEPLRHHQLLRTILDESFLQGDEIHNFVVLSRR